MKPQETAAGAAPAQHTLSISPAGAALGLGKRAARLRLRIVGISPAPWTGLLVSLCLPRFQRTAQAKTRPPCCFRSLC